MKSILRNAYEGSPQISGDFDRSQVLENTNRNAQLAEAGTEMFRRLPNRSSESVPNGDRPNLRWDEANLNQNEQDKTPKMKIEEPKTPYLGAVGDSEYYLTDDDDAESVKSSHSGQVIRVDELDSFSLGESDHVPAPTQTTVRARRESVQDAEGEQADQTDLETEQERHRRFENMRKQHYNMREAFVHVDEDEDDEE